MEDYISKMLRGEKPTVKDFMGPQSTLGIMPGEWNPGSPQAKPTGTLDKFLTSPGGGMLMNLLAQSGYSTTPSSPFGAIGKAALMSQRQGQARDQAELQRRFVESQIGLNQAKVGAEGATGRFGKINPGMFTPDSLAVFERTNRWDDLVPRESAAPSAVEEWEYFRGLPPEDQDQYLNLRRANRPFDVPGSGLVVQDPLNPSRVEEVVPEGSVVRGISNRELQKGEAGRGRVLDESGGFVPVPGSQAETEQRERSREIEAGSTGKSIQAQTVVEDIHRFNQIIDDVPFGRAAAFWENRSPMWQPEAYRNGVSLVESVKGNVGVDSLLRIKQSGAGLGQVPQSQLDLLSRLLGELNLNQSKDQFIRTWNRMGKVYAQIWDQADTELAGLGAIPPSVFTPIVEKPDEIPQNVWDQMPPSKRALWLEN